MHYAKFVETGGSSKQNHLRQSYTFLKLNEKVLAKDAHIGFTAFPALQQTRTDENGSDINIYVLP